MAKDTPLKLRSANIYQVFLRQHTKTGTFLSLIEDLERIKSLGMDFIYLLPIHPIGKINRKGSIGSPYSVKDYFLTNSDYGSKEDFIKLINKTHQMGMKVIIDIVFNHTSFDATLLQTNPEWYLKRKGELFRKVEDWSDVTDLDFSKLELWDYLIDVLKYWLSLQVDGFRFDVASVIPLDFWLKARKELKKLNPDVVFLGESVHLDLVKNLRDRGFYCASDAELYEAFDILYDYDINSEFNDYIMGKDDLGYWLKSIIRQESIFPQNYIKLRYLENHDTKRIAALVEDKTRLINLTALQCFLKGTIMIYAGQEYRQEKRPNLFEIDKIDLSPKESELTNLIHRMSHLKKDSLFQTGIFNIHIQPQEVAVISYENETSIAYGIFNVGNIKGGVNILLPNGVYQNILYPNQVKVENKQIVLSEKPIVIFSMKNKI